MIITDLLKLKSKSDVVENEDDAKKIIAELQLALDLSNKKGTTGIGLAAIQIGIDNKVAIVRMGDIKIDLVNCNIVKRYNKIISEEGCLSLPGIVHEVERSEQIVVMGNDFGSYKEFCAYGIVGICIQHEMDHWDGILITDKEKKNNINIGPNQPCLCGKLDLKTGKRIKYKKCCGRK